MTNDAPGSSPQTPSRPDTKTSATSTRPPRSRSSKPKPKAKPKPKTPATPTPDVGDVEPDRMGELVRPADETADRMGGG